jgi:hypothetical protein
MRPPVQLLRQQRRRLVCMMTSHMMTMMMTMMMMMMTVIVGVQARPVVRNIQSTHGTGSKKFSFVCFHLSFLLSQFGDVHLIIFLFFVCFVGLFVCLF